jgi:hypothetical protein
LVCCEASSIGSPQPYRCSKSQPCLSGKSIVRRALFYQTSWLWVHCDPWWVMVLSGHESWAAIASVWRRTTRKTSAYGPRSNNDGHNCKEPIGIPLAQRASKR